MRRTGSTRWLWAVLPWLIVIAFIAIGYQSMKPPSPRPAADEAEFSATRAIDHVAAIATEPHPMGSPEIETTRAYIESVLSDLDIPLEHHTVIAPDYFGGRAAPVEVVNLIARLPGSNSTGAIALIAHYDTVPATAGANDNTCAVATLLETARAVRAGPQLRNDVILIFTDGEEPSPRPGSTSFVSEHAAFTDIALAVNFEASGGSGASLLVETSGPETWLLNELGAIDSHPAAFSFATEIASLIGEIGTDFDQFRNAGTPGMHFAYLHGSSIYHTESDDLDSVNLGSLQHHGNHALGIAQRFGSLDIRTPTGEGAAVFFSIRPFFVHYPATWALPLMLAAVAGLVSGIVRRARSSNAPISVRYLALSPLLVLGSAILGGIFWALIAAARPTLGVVEGYFYFACLVGAALFTNRWVARRTRAPQSSELGVLILWTVLMTVTAFAGRGFSYLFLWPGLAFAGALWWRARGPVSRILRFTMVAAATLLLTTPAIDFFLQFSYPRPGNPDSSMPVAAVVPLFLAALVAGMLAQFWPVHQGLSEPEFTAG